VELFAFIRIIEQDDRLSRGKLCGEHLARFIVLAGQGAPVGRFAGGDNANQIAEQPFARAGRGRLDQVHGRASVDHAPHKRQ
jgi:hypothetical protein